MINIFQGTTIRGGQRLFDNFSWQVKHGEHWVIRGANGSGKTMLLEMLAGTTHLTHGHIDMDFITGTTWDERHAERKRHVHYIPTHALQTFLPFAQGLYYQQRYYASPDDNTQRVRDILGEIQQLDISESLSIAHLLDISITRLSNGQMKKVLLHKSLLHEPPRLLLLDYPFEGLDVESRHDLCNLIDLMAARFGVQFIITDNHYTLPTIINHELILDAFAMAHAGRLPARRQQQPAAAKTPPLPPSSSGQEALVAIHNLVIRYGTRTIMENFSWTVRRGDRWALIGRNGAGKTTLFSMIFADHPQAYAQEIYLFGRRRGTGESIWDIKRRIAYLGPELVTYLSKGETQTGRHYLRTLNRNIDPAAIETLVQLFDAASFVDQPLRAMSSGQLQVVLIINAFVAERELVLLDEPFQFLDARQRSNLSRYLHEHLHADTTLILITHDERDIAEWTTQTLRL